MAGKGKPLFLDLDSLKSVAFVMFGTLCLIVGIGTYFGGCDESLQPMCSQYSIVDVEFTNYTVVHEICSVCNSTTKDCQVKCRTGQIHCRRTCDTVCATYESFDCYSSHATGSYGSGLSSSCIAEGAAHFRNETEAMQEVQDSFPLGSERTVLVPKPSKNSDACIMMDSNEAVQASRLAEVGVAFLAITVILFVANFYLLNHLHGSWSSVWCVSVLLSCCGIHQMSGGRNRAGSYVKVLPFSSLLPYYRVGTDNSTGDVRGSSGGGERRHNVPRRTKSNADDSSEGLVGKNRRPSFTDGGAAGGKGGAPATTYRNR